MRNPYDRFVSEANYRTGRRSLQEQMDICKNATAHTNHDLFAHCRPQTDFVGINGDKVDHLFLMFDDGVEAFLHKHGYTLANISKHSHVSEKKWAAADLTKEQREWIEATYADDFNLLLNKFRYKAVVTVAAPSTQIHMYIVQMATDGWATLTAHVFIVTASISIALCCARVVGGTGRGWAKRLSGGFGSVGSIWGSSRACRRLRAWR